LTGYDSCVAGCADSSLAMLVRSGPGIPSALGLRAHSGWAVLVVAAGTLKSPVLLQRRRIQLADPAIPGSVQPYHAARSMQLPDAAKYLDQCANSCRRLGRQAIQTAVDELIADDYHVAGACILLGSGRSNNDLAAILASHPAIHTAEGEFFRNALRSACVDCSVIVSTVKERDLFHHAAASFHLSPETIASRFKSIGKTIGPPWTQDEKLGALAAWLLLANAASG
jgi:hypothetical protein